MPLSDQVSERLVYGLSGSIGSLGLLAILLSIIYCIRRRRNPRPDRAMPIDERALDGWKECFRLCGNSLVNLVKAPYNFVIQRRQRGSSQNVRHNQDNEAAVAVDGHSSDNIQMENVHGRPKSNNTIRPAPANDDGQIHNEQQDNNSKTNRSVWSILPGWKRNKSTPDPDPNPQLMESPNYDDIQPAPFRQPRGERLLGTSTHMG